MRQLFNFRYYVLFALVGVAITLFFMDCPEEHYNDWLKFQLGTKPIAVACGYIALKLIDRWNYQNKIPWLTKVANKVDEILG